MQKPEVPTIIQLPRFLDARGNLSFAEQGAQIPFGIARTYWIYDVPGGEALSGAFEVMVDDGNGQRLFQLNRSYYGLYVPAGTWREMREFSTNSLALEFGSMPYDRSDYITDYEEFLKLKKNGKI